ncbi:MAG: ABC transporter substrate-binding protein [Qingshengfaniella sp.]
MKHCIVFLFTATISVLSASLAMAELTVIDMMGRTHRLTKPAERAVITFHFEDFLAVAGPDAYDRVVGINKAAWRSWRNSQWQAYAAAIPRLEELTDVGGVAGNPFSLEAAVALRPDVLIVPSNNFNAMADIYERIEATGVPVIVVDYHSQTVERHVASTLIIGQVMGTEERARELAKIYAAEVADVEARVAAAQAAGAKIPSVYLEVGRIGPHEYGVTFGGGYMWGGMIEMAGGNNIGKEVTDRSAPISPEFLLVKDPDVIFMAGAYWLDHDESLIMGFGIDPQVTRNRLDGFLKRDGWANLKAVKNGDIHALYLGGVRTLYDYAYLQQIAKVLYPEAFADVDPMANLQAFYETYMPIKAEGSFMVGLSDTAGSN